MKKSHRTILLCVLLGVVTLATYWPVTRCGFINFDDPKYVTQNPQIREGLSWTGLNWAFHATLAGNWHPVTWLTHMLDCQIYGLRPAGHHLTNLLFHTADAILLFLFLKCGWRSAERGVQTEGTGRQWEIANHKSEWVSFFVAALFALHPLHVESVAWVAERKDVLSAFFFMLTLWAYLRYVEKSVISSQRAVVSSDRTTDQASRFTFQVSLFYLLSLLFFACGLMSKPMLVTVPFVMLLLDFWPLGRFGAHSLQSTVHGPKAEGEGQTSEVIDEERLDSGLRTTDGGPLATRKSQIVNRILLEKLPFLALSAASCVVTMLVQRGAGAVAPLRALPLGFRISNALISYVSYALKMVWPVKLAVLYPLPAAWPGPWVVGAAIILAGVSALALGLARKAPWLAFGWLWYGVTLVPVIGIVQAGRQAMADRYSYIPLIGLFVAIAWGAARVATRWPRSRPLVAAGAAAVLVLCGAETRHQLAYWQDSEALFLRALEVTRNNDRALNQYCLALMDKGKYEEAARALTAVLKVKPTLVPALLQLGIARSMQGQKEAAERVFSEAARLAPRDALTRYNLGYFLMQQDRDQEAVPELEAAVALQPNHESALFYLAKGYRKLGRTNDLITCYRQMIRLHPNALEEVNNLAWILAASPDAKFRNGAEAVQLAARACALTRYQHPPSLATLAAACAEAGRFQEAIGYAERAQSLPDGAQGALGNRITAMLEAFRAGRPYHGS